MKLLSKLKRFVRKPIVAAALATAVFGVAAWSITPANSNAATDPGYDCTANSVIWCGGQSPNGSDLTELISRYDNGDGHNTHADINAVEDFSLFAIGKNDVDSMANEPSGTIVDTGTVTKTGNVILSDGTVVATNAVTAGRQSDANFACGTDHGSEVKHTNNGVTFYTREPKASFCGDSLKAFIVMKDGIFQFAILDSCGNPVAAQPKLPGYTITKQVAAHGKTNFSSNVSVAYGSDVDFKITVTSTGAVAADNITVKDTLPSDMKEVPGTMVKIDKDGSSASASDTNLFAGGADTIDSLAPGQKVTYEFEAKAGVSNKTYPACNNEPLTNSANVSSPVFLPGPPATATATTTCTPPPTTQALTCTGITGPSSLLVGQQGTFVATGAATGGATITSYTFVFGGDGSTPVTQTSPTATHTFTTPSTSYTANVTINGTVDGKPVSISTPACTIPITVTPIPSTPAGMCTALNVATTDNITYAAAASYTVSGGATLTGASINWGDGSAVVQGTTGANNTVNFAAHTYAKQTASFTAIATLTFSNGVTNSTCSRPVNINGPQPAYSCDLFTLSADNPTRVATVTAFNTTAINGAVFKSADINWGDGVTDSGLTTVVGKTHTYAAVNNYNVVATAHFTVNGQDVTATSAACAKPANFTSVCVPTANENADCSAKVCTPPQTGTYPNCTTPCVPTASENADCTPKVLVNTGAGSVVGLFAITTAIGTFGYRYLLGRRLSGEL